MRLNYAVLTEKGIAVPQLLGQAIVRGLQRQEKSSLNSFLPICYMLAGNQLGSSRQGCCTEGSVSFPLLKSGCASLMGCSRIKLLSILLTSSLIPPETPQVRCTFLHPVWKLSRSSLSSLLWKLSEAAPLES